MNKPTVTVAISAYNEEKNILNFLKSALVQKERGFRLKEIWIHSDGSTDKTVELAKSLKSKRIKVWDHKKRVGKSTWLNKIYQDLDTNILVQADADVIFTRDLTVHDLIQPLIKDPKVGMCGGNPIPLSGKTFWEKTAKIAFEPYQSFRSQVRGGDNIFSAIGQILAFRKELVKKINIPHDMVTNDIYTYFCCLTLGYKYKFVKSAIVHYRAPMNISDIIKQNTRIHVGCERMYHSFNTALVTKELSIPKFLLYRKLLKQFLKFPLQSTIYYLINKYCQVRSESIGKTLDAKWPIAKSTKLLNQTFSK